MWQPDGQIIQIEYGKAIGQVTAIPGKSGFMGFGKKPDDIGGQLVNITDEFQSEILEKEKLQIPGVLWMYNPNLEPTQVILRIGLETHVLVISNFGELFGLVLDRCRFFQNSTSDRSEVRNLLDNSLKHVSSDEYQEAFELQCAVYYGAAQRGFEYEMTRCLSDTGLIFAKNGDIGRAKLALFRSWELCSSPNMMDIALKSQVAYNAAQICVIERDLETAFKLFYASGMTAKNLSFSHGVFMALIGIAHVSTLAQNWNLALSVLEQAESVVAEGDSPNYQAAYQVSKSIRAIKDAVMAKSQQTEQTRSLFDGLKKQIFFALTRSIIQAVVYKVFGVSGGLIFAIFGKQEDIRLGDGGLYIEKPRGDITFK